MEYREEAALVSVSVSVLAAFSKFGATFTSYRSLHDSSLQLLRDNFGFVAFIHPNLEYATAVWDPHLSKDIQKLESVQRFACRSVPKDGMMPIVTCCSL